MGQEYRNIVLTIPDVENKNMMSSMGNEGEGGIIVSIYIFFFSFLFFFFFWKGIFKSFNLST